MGHFSFISVLIFTGILFDFFFLSPNAWAIYTEVGLSAAYRKTSYSQENTVESQSSTTSVSFYLWERSALEFSYTDSVAVRRESISGNPTLTVIQYSTIAGCDLVLALSDRAAVLQPFLKGGVARVTKKQVAQYDGVQADEISIKPSVAPSAGVGIKVKVSEAFGVQFSYDSWRTPIDETSQTTDSAARVGVNWIF